MESCIDTNLRKAVLERKGERVMNYELMRRC